MAAEHRPRLVGVRAWLASLWAGTVLGLAFVVPVGQLAIWALHRLHEDLDARYLDLLGHTLSLAAVACLAIVAAAFVLSYTRRHHPHPAGNAAVRLATLGYALPGSVLAVGVMMSFTWVDARIDLLARSWLGVSTGLPLAGSLLGLLLAYLVRFMAVSFAPLDSALERIRPSLREAARGLGASRGRILWRIYLPMLRPGLLAGLLLAFVDVMKELPATLMLRPFGWDTLAVRIFELTSEGEWVRAALPAITLVLAGLAPVVLLIRRSGSRQ
jgi:iron(III) transport system permease protein